MTVAVVDRHDRESTVMTFEAPSVWASPSMRPWDAGVLDGAGAAIGDEEGWAVSIDVVVGWDPSDRTDEVTLRALEGM